jgi:sigma-B regulation protein RsbU (phosphoserine phosphatase)
MNAELGSLLVVDDEELNREGLARHLRRHGYEVTLARSGREALELLGERRFDLVLLDIMMPGMNGLEVLKFLRRVDSLLDLPIIMVTARGESEDMVEALELGANDYVTKPLDLRVVLARLRTQLALRQAVSQVTRLEQQLDGRNKELESAAANLAEANERMKRDLEAAARIQQAFLPALPPEVPGARLAWTCKPRGQLARDFLTFFRFEQRLGLCLLDVGGHGIAAALLSVTASHLLAQFTTTPGSHPGLGPAPLPPAQVVGQLSKQFAGQGGHPFTLLYGVLTPPGPHPGLADTGGFCFVCAGHPGPVHLPMGKPPALLEASDFPIGVGGNYREHSVKLQAGDRLVLYTDGLTAARNADGEHFGIRRLLEALDGTRHVPLSASLEATVQEVERWCGNSPRQDLSLLLIEMTATGEHS